MATKTKKTTTTTAKKNYPKVDTKETVLRFLLDSMERDDLMPWDNGRLNGDRMAINRATGKQYRGINRMLLNAVSSDLENPTQEWVTFMQAKNLKGHVKEGQHGYPIVFYKIWDKKRHCAADKDSEKEDTYPILKLSYVYDLCQCEGIDTRRSYVEIDHPPMKEVDALIEKFAEATNLKLELGKKADSGFYVPSLHKVSVAGLKYHEAPDDYYSTLFHELVHSTGLAMGRNMKGFFGGELYSQEEIVAECGAMLLCMEFGVTKSPRSNSASYVKHWGDHLKEHKDWLFKGMADAEKAVKFILEKMGHEPQFV